MKFVQKLIGSMEFALTIAHQHFSKFRFYRYLIRSGSYQNCVPMLKHGLTIWLKQEFLTMTGPLTTAKTLQWPLMDTLQ